MKRQSYARPQIRTNSYWLLPNWWTVTATDASVSSATDMELTEQLLCFRQIRVIITRSIPQLIVILLCVFFSAAEAFPPEVSNWPQLNFGSVILKQPTNYASACVRACTHVFDRRHRCVSHANQFVHQKSRSSQDEEEERLILALRQCQCIYLHSISLHSHSVGESNTRPKYACDWDKSTSTSKVSLWLSGGTGKRL